MNRVFFADDDVLTLNKLRGLIDWEQFGYEIAGQAMDGASAIDRVRACQPDLLVLDIEMPRMNGIEVARALHAGQPGLHILVLSNYDSYDYVRAAMRYGVYDYLLKHRLNAELLGEKLRELDEIRLRESLTRSRSRYFEAVAKQNYLRELVLNGVTDDKRYALMKTQKEFSSNCSVLMVIQIVNFILFTHFDGKEGREKLTASILNLAENIFSTLHNGLIAPIENGQFIVLFHFHNQVSQKKVMESASSYARLLAANLRKLLNVTALCQVSDILSDLTDAPRYYRKTLQLLEERPIEGERALHRIGMEEEREILDALSALSLERVRAAVRKIGERCAGAPWNLRQQTLSLLLEIGERFAAASGGVSSGSTRRVQERFRASCSMEDGLKVIDAFYEDILCAAAARSSSGYSPRVREAARYIQANYAHDISLPEVAQAIGVSGTYLSRQFKRETGESFVDYVTAVRIDAAKRLMRKPGTELKDVWRLVGFHSYNYFLRVFKSKTGHTPGQEKR